MTLLRDLGVEPVQSPWQHWIVRVEQIGRISLPAGARRALGTPGSVQAVSRDRMLVLQSEGSGTSIPIDGRGRLLLPAWFRGTTRLSSSVFVAACSTLAPTVVVAPTGILEELVSHLAVEAR
jgi:DNA-binding transcriptional regulator/RsmH inhibitor MraZ